MICEKCLLLLLGTIIIYSFTAHVCNPRMDVRHFLDYKELAAGVGGTVVAAHVCFVSHSTNLHPTPLTNY